MTTSTVQTNYDPLDLNSYSLNRLPKKKLTKTGAFFKKWGLPIAAILFFVLAYVVQIPILNQKQEIMFALFATALFLWISEALPNYDDAAFHGHLCRLRSTGDRYHE